MRPGNLVSIGLEAGLVVLSLVSPASAGAQSAAINPPVSSSSGVVAHATGPIPLTRPGDWASDADYPPAALQRKATGISGFKLTISVLGVPVRCEITRSSGDPDLDAATCALMINRARFKPATDRSGMAIVSTFASSVRWQSPLITSTPGAVQPSASLAFPPPTPGHLVEAYDIRADGTLTDCTVVVSGAMTDNPAYKNPEALCLRFVRYKPVLDAAGKPIRTHFVIDLTVKAAAVP
jgi:periplasmic protein TonB